jgi:hypothetical protein
MTPPPSRVIVQGIITSVSALSLLLTTSHSCHTNARVASARTQHDTQLNADDLNAADLSDEDAPSPKKALPDFTTQKSDDDSVASGNDSAGWEKEEDRVVNAFAAQVEADDWLEDISIDTPVKEVHEFMLARGGGECRWWWCCSRVQDEASLIEEDQCLDAEGNIPEAQSRSGWPELEDQQRLKKMPFYEYFMSIYEHFMRVPLLKRTFLREKLFWVPISWFWSRKLLRD